MSGLYLTANDIKVQGGSVADWYISFGKRVESISKKLEDDEDPWDDVCENCKHHMDQCSCCGGCGYDLDVMDCQCPSAFEMERFMYGYNS